MLGVNVTYIMKPGKREEFLTQVVACGALDAIRKEDGCLQYDYFLPVDQADQLLLVERWTSREAQTIHMTQPHMADLAAIKERCALDVSVIFYDLP